jgi:transposase-like protein
VDNNPPCPKCQGNSKRDGLSRNGKQLYLCTQCSRMFQLSYEVTNNPPCPRCNGISRRRGINKGKQVYSCNRCQGYFRCTPQQQRQHEIRQQAEQLPALIEQKLPKNLPVEIREELQQELVLAALAGEFELSELDQVIINYRRKVYRQSLTGFAYVSLDAVIPHTEGLTYGDTLAG